MKLAPSLNPSVQPARVRVDVGTRVFVGDLLLPDVAFRSRVSDVMNDPKRRFLPLANVEALDGKTGKVLGHTSFLLLRVEAIDVLIPLLEPAEAPGLAS